MIRDAILWHVLVSARVICDRHDNESDANDYLGVVVKSPAYFAALGNERHAGLSELLEELRTHVRVEGTDVHGGENGVNSRDTQGRGRKTVSDVVVVVNERMTCDNDFFRRSAMKLESSIPQLILVERPMDVEAFVLDANTALLFIDSEELSGQTGMAQLRSLWEWISKVAQVRYTRVWMLVFERIDQLDGNGTNSDKRRGLASKATSDGTSKLMAFALGVTTPSFGITVRQAWGGTGAAAAALGSIMHSVVVAANESGTAKILDRPWSPVFRSRQTRAEQFLADLPCLNPVSARWVLEKTGTLRNLCSLETNALEQVLSPFMSSEQVHLLDRILHCDEADNGCEVMLDG